MATFARPHALIIGIGDYQNNAWSAPITVDNAQAVAASLRDPSVGDCCGSVPHSYSWPRESNPPI